jgi:hypothetical protein
VPEDADKDQLEEYQLRVEQALNLATEVAGRRMLTAKNGSSGVPQH